MENNNKIKGVSIIESLVCLVIIGIGFVAVMQLSAFSIGAMDRSIEKNKINFLSEMVLEDMIGDPTNSSSYGNFNETCAYSNTGGSNLHNKQKDKWRNKLSEKNHIQIKKSISGSYKERKLPCSNQDSKKTFINTKNNNTSGKVNFITGKGKRKKYLGVVVK